MSASPETFLNAELGSLSAAEEFFDYFGVPYDQHVVNVSRLHIRLTAMLDLRDPAPAGLDLDALTGPDYLLPQAIAAEASARKLEGVLVPSATGVGEQGRDFNVVIFTGNLRPGSEITLVDTKTPRLPA